MKITRARVVSGHIVRFYLDDGTSVDRDFSLVCGEVWDPLLSDPRKFRQVRVKDGHPYWPGDVDVCPDAILRGKIGRGRPPKFATIGARGTLWSGRGVTSL
jgi:hypothetical protein